MLLLGVLGLAFAGGETKAKKSVSGCKEKSEKNTSDDQEEEKKQRSKATSSQSSPPSSRKSYVHSVYGQTTRLYTVPVNRGQYESRDVKQEHPVRSAVHHKEEQERQQAIVTRIPQHGVASTENHQYDQTTTYGNDNQYNSSSKYPNKLFNQKRSTNDDNASRSFSTTVYDMRQNTQRLFNERTQTSEPVRQVKIVLTACFHINNPKRQNTSNNVTHPKHTPNIEQKETSTSQTKKASIVSAR